MSLVILFNFLCAQHVSDINISIIRSLRLCCWITTSVVLFSVRCVLEIWCGWVWVVSVLQAEEQVVLQLLMMDILMSETCWAHKKWNKISSDIKLVFYSSTITMMHGPINIRSLYTLHALILTMETTRENLGIVRNFISTNPYPFNASLGERYGTAILTTGVTNFFF